LHGSKDSAQHYSNFLRVLFKCTAVNIMLLLHSAYLKKVLEMISFGSQTCITPNPTHCYCLHSSGTWCRITGLMGAQWCSHIQGREHPRRNVLGSLKTRPPYCPEMLGTNHPVMWHHIPKESKPLTTSLCKPKNSQPCCLLHITSSVLLVKLKSTS
jgi:hypothetical protein